jgi:hypothetical protein
MHKVKKFIGSEGGSENRLFFSIEATVQYKVRMEAAVYFETSVHNYKSQLCHIPGKINSTIDRSGTLTLISLSTIHCKYLGRADV